MKQAVTILNFLIQKAGLTNRQLEDNSGKTCDIMSIVITIILTVITLIGAIWVLLIRNLLSTRNNISAKCCSSIQVSDENEI